MRHHCVGRAFAAVVKKQPREQCVISKPFGVPSWREICAVSVIGFYAMPSLNEEYLSSYVRRVSESAQSLLGFVKKDVAADAKLEWETGERTTEQMLEMGATEDLDSTWAVIVGINVEFRSGDADGSVAQSFGDLWIPRFSSVMQFHVPFDDAPNVSILDGDQAFALILQR